MKKFVFVIWATSFVISVRAADFKKQDIEVGGKTIHSEIAETEEQREQGLMFRKVLKDSDGMLFIFDREQPMSFWMKNTFIPLSIGFFSEKKILNEVIEMEPVSSEMDQNPKIYRAKKNAMYALEAPKGWFSKNKIKPGASMKLLSPPKSKKK